MGSNYYGVDLLIFFFKENKPWDRNRSLSFLQWKKNLFSLSHVNCSDRSLSFFQRKRNMGLQLYAIFPSKKKKSMSLFLASLSRSLMSLFLSDVSLHPQMQNSAAPTRNQPAYLSIFISSTCSSTMWSLNLRSPPSQAYAPPRCRFAIVDPFD